MAEKYFLVNPNIEFSSKEVIEEIHNEQLSSSSEKWNNREQLANEAMHEECTLKHVSGRVIVRVNEQSKNTHKFSNGTTIRRERAFNNLNFREVNPSNGIVVSAENIPKGTEILFDYTALHDSNKIFSYKSKSTDVFYYSFKEHECFAWKGSDGEYQPFPNMEFALRVFKPYQGKLIGIQPTLLKDVLYVTTGLLKGNIVKTLKSCDYQIVFTGADGKENNLIRFRHSDNPDFEKEEEAILIQDDLTEELNNGNLLVGLNVHDAKKLI